MESLSEIVVAVTAQIGLRRADALGTIDQLHSYRLQVESASASFDNPAAVLEYIDFFTAMIGRAAAECDRIAEDIPEGLLQAHADALRQVAADSAAEQRRCLLFREQWINKPLPDERLRPLLNDISVTTRDQLTAFRDLDNAAARLEEVLKPAPAPAPGERKAFDRRALFTRLFKP